jgi:hypothetical protein
MRHYCDFCKKSGAKKPAMLKHELGCTANAGRVCGLCRLSNEEQLSTTELVEIWLRDGFEALRMATAECPACMLTAMRHSYDPKDRETWRSFSEPIYAGYATWQFKDAMKAWWKDYNEDHADPHPY